MTMRITGLSSGLDTESIITELTKVQSNKVDKVAGKGLSTEDYTSEEKTKLSNIEAGATNTVVDSALSSSSENPVQNKIITNALDGKADSFDFVDELDTTINNLIGRV